jgi:hypothetical protein
MKLLGLVLVDPPHAAKQAIARPRPMAWTAGLLALIALAGASTLPRQLALLSASLAPTGDLMQDMHYSALKGGLIRIILADRVIPPPTIILAGVILALAAEPILALAEERRRTVWAVLLLGIAPLLIQRVGELAVTYVASAGARPHPGDALGLPQRFTTGPLLFWSGGDPPPWLLSFNQRFNLVSLWSVVLWSIGLRELDGRHWRAWHVALPVCCLGLAAFFTWWLGPMVTTLVLGSP